MHIQTIEKAGEKIFSIVKKLVFIELKSLENYAEFLSQNAEDSKFLNTLKNAKLKDEVLNESELEGIKISDRDIKKEKIRHLKNYIKERGLSA